MYWIHHKANHLAVDGDDTVAGDAQTLTLGRTEVIWTTKAFRHQVTDFRLWAEKDLGINLSLCSAASKGWSCWAPFLCWRGDAFLQRYPAALRRDMCRGGRDTCRGGSDHFQARHRLFAQTLLLLVQGLDSRTVTAPAAVCGSLAISFQGTRPIPNSA